ncbi:MAG: hypothetical protein QW272_07735 [Candidatus Methanomethylicaceae archaeon]
MLSFLISYNEYLFAWIFTQGTLATTLQPVLATMWFMIGELNIMAAAKCHGFNCSNNHFAYFFKIYNEA